MNNTERIVIGNLLKEIEDQSLQKALRRVLLKNESIIDAIKQERPELDDKDLVELTYITDEPKQR